MMVNYMALSRLHMEMMTHILGNTRMVREKDMEHMSGLVEADTLDNTCRETDSDMEFTDRQVELYNKDNINRVNKKVMVYPGILMAQSIMDSTRIICAREREY